MITIDATMITALQALELAIAMLRIEANEHRFNGGQLGTRTPEGAKAICKAQAVESAIKRCERALEVAQATRQP